MINPRPHPHSHIVACKQTWRGRERRRDWEGRVGGERAGKKDGGGWGRGKKGEGGSKQQAARVEEGEEEGEEGESSSSKCPRGKQQTRT